MVSSLKWNLFSSTVLSHGTICFQCYNIKFGILLEFDIWHSWELRTFARKSSNIDFFIKLLLQLGYELLLSEMQKNWGVIDFVSELRYLKGHPNFEKLVFLTRYGSNVCMSKNITNEFLEQNFLCQFLYELVY